jgi:hypothetical protein
MMCAFVSWQPALARQRETPWHGGEYSLMMNIITETTSDRRRVTESELCAWFGQGGIGDTLTYHRGSLTYDRSPTASRLPRREQAELTRVARRARALAEAGLAELVQLRHGPDDYEYKIIIRPRLPCSGNALQRVLAGERS